MNIDSVQKTPSVMLADKARKMRARGVPLIELQTGDPNYPTPAVITTAAIKALKAGHTHYSFTDGLPELRGIIANTINDEYKLKLTIDNVIVTQGASQGINAILSALLDFDDEVIVLEPNWPTVDSLSKINGARVIKISHISDDNSLKREIESAITKRSKIIYINSPNNPTGDVFSAERISMLSDISERHDLYLLSDEVYKTFAFEKLHASVLMNLNKNPRLICVDSFSKRFSMTGWRIGFIVGNTEILRKISKASQLAITNVAPFIQYGALEALKNIDALELSCRMRDELGSRRLLLWRECLKQGLEVELPEGALYLFIRSRSDDIEFSNKLLDKYKVCTVPGSAYGKSGAGYVRISFATDTSMAIEGISRFARLYHEET